MDKKVLKEQDGLIEAAPSDDGCDFRGRQHSGIAAIGGAEPLDILSPTSSKLAYCELNISQARSELIRNLPSRSRDPEGSLATKDRLQLLGIASDQRESPLILLGLANHVQGLVTD